MKYGFEREYFLYQQGAIIAVPLPLGNFYADGSGYLVESRGQPNSDPVVAAFLSRAADYALKKAVKKHKCSLRCEASARIPLEVQRTARRTHVKGRIKYQNLYGLDLPPVRTEDTGAIWATAGLHVHFSNPRKVDGRVGQTVVSEHFDFVQIIRDLDKEFKDWIEAAERVPGMYELKPHGIEYRSLPATIDPLLVASFLDAREGQ